MIPGGMRRMWSALCKPRASGDDPDAAAAKAEKAL